MATGQGALLTPISYAGLHDLRISTSNYCRRTEVRIDSRIGEMDGLQRKLIQDRT